MLIYLGNVSRLTNKKVKNKYVDFRHMYFVLRFIKDFEKVPKELLAIFLLFISIKIVNNS